jgi:phenylacetic acid degradation operon negative regulatory protein
MAQNGPVAAPEPILSRRHATGSDSARGLLFTLLGEFVLPGDGAAWTSAVIDVLGRLGVEEKAARQALMRTAADGWLASERVGRRTVWRLTPAAEALLVDGTERIYGFTGAAEAWDGRWLLVLARTPETERASRHLLRTRMAWAGFGSPAPGVWVSPHADRLGPVESVLAEAGVGDAQVFVAEHHGHGDLPALVRQAWDLDAIEAEYEEFVDRFAAAGTDDPLGSTVELVHAWRRFPWIDPLLPAALLPTPWSGVEAAGVFADRHAGLAAPARGAWTEVNR